MNDELWRVQLSTGEIRMMTLDALDRAFDEGLIDARVPVLPPGASAWTTLGEAAGLDDCPTEETPSLSPMAVASAAPSSALIVPPSDTKLDLDLDLPDNFDELRPRRGRGLAVVGVASALALVSTLAVFAGKVGTTEPAPVDVKAAAVEAPPPAAVEALPAPAPKEAPPMEATKDSATGSGNEAPKEAAKDAPKGSSQDAKQGMSDWQKRMLADADKAREDKARVKSQERAEKPAPQPKKTQPQQPTKMSNGLLNGGDKFDPLNGAL